MREEQPVVWVSRGRAAEMLGCSGNTVARAAKRIGIGIVVEDGRLAAVRTLDLPKLKAAIHPTSGNPVWIASRKKKPRRKTV